MIKVLSIVGTRPEIIKMAPVIQQLQKTSSIVSQVCTTSQHRTMQDQMMQLFGLKADYDLDVMKPNQDLFYLTSEMLVRLQSVLQQAKPDLVLVQGDTTTSFVGALAAFYCQIPVGHVEAGLRTHNLLAPFPEEANRQLTGRLVTMHFAPTETSKRHLLQEGVAENRIWVTGNTVIDALLWMRQHLNLNRIKAALPGNILQLIEQQKPYVLITGHRRENFGEGFLSICRAIQILATRYPKWNFVYPVHLNPNVRKPVFDLLAGYANIHLIEPVDYEPFVHLMDHCKIVLTDSGGVQEEAPSLGKPVLVMREVTERPEGIEAGTAKLVGTAEATLIAAVSELIDDPLAYQRMANAVNPYGDGTAAQQIVNHITGHLLL